MNILLDITRGLAALWVFLYHARNLFIESSSLVYDFASIGSLGVPMFFVISGYVITYSAESNLNSNESAFQFLKRRFLRIYPAFWISIIVLLCLPYVLKFIVMVTTGDYISPASIIERYNTSEWLHILALTKVFFANSSYLPVEFTLINGVYWTLAIEFQFYLVVFASLLFKKYYRLLIVLVTVFAIVNQYNDLSLNFGLFIHYWPLFAIGILLAYLHRYKICIEKILPPSTYILLLIGYVPLVYVLITSDYGVSDFQFAILFGVFLWFVSPLEKVLSIVKTTSNGIAFWVLELFLILGAMSFTVYLLHSKLFHLPRYVMAQFYNSSDLEYGIFTMMLTLIMCLPFYLFVERQFMSKKYLNRQNKLFFRKN